MTQPARPTPPLDPSASGTRRILPTDTGGESLPPTPEVLVERPRITTGRYAIVRPSRPDR